MLENMLEVAVKAADKKLAFDISVLNLEGVSSLSDYFIIASGNSDRQAMAIAEEIDDKMSEAGYECCGKEGQREGSWILLDYGDIVIHVFRKEAREFYGLDKLWENASKIEIEKYLEV